MLPLERQNRILELLEQRQAVTVDELCALLFSSGATIRRDLQVLEQNGMIRRTHGGAVHIDSHTHDFPMTLRENENLSAKDLIASKAVSLIRDGQTIFMDSSSTVCRLARRLKGFQHLRIITNGLKTASILAEIDGIEVYSTGGRLRDNAMSFTGSQAVDFSRQFNADLAFISCRGIDPDIGITDTEESEAIIKRSYIENTRRVALLCDNTKFGQRCFCKIAPIQAIWKIITNVQLPAEYGQ